MRNSSNHKETKKKNKGTKELQNSQKTINSMAIISPYLLVINLNVNMQTFSVERYKVSE